jgi:hypothetical protein
MINLRIRRSPLAEIIREFGMYFEFNKGIPEILNTGIAINIGRKYRVYPERLPGSGREACLAEQSTMS